MTEVLTIAIQIADALDTYRRYGVSADGKRFLMNVPVAGGTLAPITVVLNWQALLKK